MLYVEVKIGINTVRAPSLVMQLIGCSKGGRTDSMLEPTPVVHRMSLDSFS